MPEIVVSLRVALETVREACRLPADSDAALQARFRQLIEMGVTGLTRPTAHVRHRYGITELAQLAVAVVLMKAQMQPAVAARIVRECWPELAPYVLAGIGDALPDRFRRLRPPLSGRRALIEGTALAILGSKPVRGTRGGGPLPGIRSMDEPGAAVDEGATDWDSGTYVDFGGFMPALFRLLVAHAAAPEDVWDSLTRLRQDEVSTI